MSVCGAEGQMQRAGRRRCVRGLAQAGVPARLRVVRRQLCSLRRMQCPGRVAMYRYLVQPAQTAELVDVVVAVPRQVERRQSVHGSDVQDDEQASQEAANLADRPEPLAPKA